MPRTGSVLSSDLHLDLLVLVRLQVLRLGLEAAEEGAPVRVRAVHEDELAVLKPLQQLHPHVGLREREREAIIPLRRCQLQMSGKGKESF